MLGKYPDFVLAEQLNRPVSSVRARRQRLGKLIAARQMQTLFLDKSAWRPEDDFVLGKHSDMRIAIILGRRVADVTRRREELGLPARIRRRLWTPSEEALLGQFTDVAVARKLGCAVFHVRQRRRRLGIARARPGHAWSTKEVAWFGTLSDAEVARRTGHTTAQVWKARRERGIPPARRRWRPEEEALLGSVPARELAARLNRSVAAVRVRSLLKGIPNLPTRGKNWPSDEVALLGKLPDEEIARRTGRSLAGVIAARSNRRIRQGGKAEWFMSKTKSSIKTKTRSCSSHWDRRKGGVTG